MKILLVKCHRKAWLPRIEPIVTEPLELEYLSAVLKSMDIEHRIHDSLMEGQSYEDAFRDFKPDAVAFSGYVTAVDRVLSRASHAKKRDKRVKVLVGGVHAEINCDDFFSENVDYVVHSGGLATFEELARIGFNLDEAAQVKGLAWRQNGTWRKNPRRKMDLQGLPLPDRSYFRAHEDGTRYLDLGPVALLKTSFSCPYSCNFCYCRLLNNGIYEKRDMESILNEIETIPAEYIWIVDDCFLLDEKRLLAFVDGLRKKSIRKRFIAYARVDFIAGHEKIVAELASVGLVELIVGMESVTDSRLAGFEKGSRANENERAVAVARRCGVRLTGLFIAETDFTRKDFKELRKGIRGLGLDTYTVSIFTPMKGTGLYDMYKDRLTTKDLSKWDFLHLTHKPSAMGAYSFYLNFFRIYVEAFLRSRRMRRMLFWGGSELLKFPKGGRHGQRP